MLYVETSGFIKVILPEEESKRVASYLDSIEDQEWISSILTKVEISRTLQCAKLTKTEREINDLFNLSADKLELVDLKDINVLICEIANSFKDPYLRTLDAIHLATALFYKAESMLTYDKVLIEASKKYNIDIITP